MTNRDRIYQMTDKEFAMFLSMAHCGECPAEGVCNQISVGCDTAWEIWLRQEAEE